MAEEYFSVGRAEIGIRYHVANAYRQTDGA
jgi:hypothetical protein